MADKKGIGLIQSMKGKAALMGVLAIASSVVIGGVGIISINRIVNNGETETLINSIIKLQTDDKAMMLYISIILTGNILIIFRLINSRCLKMLIK